MRPSFGLKIFSLSSAMVAHRHRVRAWALSNGLILAPHILQSAQRLTPNHLHAVETTVCNQIGCADNGLCGLCPITFYLALRRFDPFSRSNIFLTPDQLSPCFRQENCSFVARPMINRRSSGPKYRPSKD